MDLVFDLTIFQATIIAIALPFVALCLFFLIIPRLRNRSGSRLMRYLSYLITPPRLGSEISQSPEDDAEQKTVVSSRADKIRLFFYYLGIVLFLTCFMIGEFYEVMIDLLLPVSQGSTGETRIVTMVIFQSPFRVEWLGSLPWMGVNTYHETWSWIFFTAAFTDNPNFLGTLIATLTLLSIGVGLVFLAPLAIKRIRQSFLPSMFFFLTGMTIFSKAATSCFAYAIALAFGNVELEYVTLAATGSMITGLSNVIIVIFPIVLTMFALFIVIGRRLWRVHYTDSKSRTWFMVYLTLSFWLGVVLTIMVV
ncbi:MAG: hypothetical protein RTS72_06850 [Candidatus Thorarchaeota archaeon]